MNMEEEGSTWCANCRREIPAVNFVMHTMHCSRNITVCQLCQEPIPRSEADTHHKEFHSVKECDLCGENMDVNHLENHKINLCPARKITCSICEIDLPAVEIIEHENYCGSRTELCDECGEYVMLKYQKLHLESNHGFLKLDDEPGPTPSWQNNERATVSNHLQYQRKIPNSVSRTSILERNPLFMSSSPSKRTNDMPQVNSVPPPHASKTVFKAGLMHPDKLVMNCSSEDNIRSVAALLSDNLLIERPTNRLKSSSSHLEEDDLVALPCEFCEALVPANQLILHQTACRPDLVKFDGKIGAGSLHPSQLPEFSSVNENLPRRFADSNQIHNNLTLPLLSIASNVREGSSSVLDEAMIPCEFCHKALSANKLFEHQSTCLHTWSGDVLHNDPKPRSKSPLIMPHQIKKTGSSSNELAPIFGSSRKSFKEDSLSNKVQESNFSKERNFEQLLPKSDVVHTSLDPGAQYVKAARDSSSKHLPPNPIHNEFKEDEDRLALLNKAKALEVIVSNIERKKDLPSSHINHISQEMSKQFSIFRRQPTLNHHGQSSLNGSELHSSSSNRTQSGRVGRTTGAIPKQKAGTSKSPLAF